MCAHEYFMCGYMSTCQPRKAYKVRIHTYIHTYIRTYTICVYIYNVCGYMFTCQARKVYKCGGKTEGWRSMISEVTLVYASIISWPCFMAAIRL